MKVLVTGGGGFLGSEIVRQLLQRGDEVSIVARGSYPQIEALGVKAFRSDLGDADATQTAVAGHDAVIHTAAKAGVWGKREEFILSNVTATQNVVDACKSEGVGRLVFTSSPSATFDGTDAKGVSNDIGYPTEFLAHYPETKALSEQIALAANSDALKVTALRPHLIWGVGDPHLVPRVVFAARTGRLKIVGDGTNKVDLTHVSNAAKAHVQALDALGTDPGPAGKAYFISDDAPVVLWDWINQLLQRLSIPPITKKLSMENAVVVGGVLEWVYRTFNVQGEPRMTRFAAQQLATCHWYDMTPARTDFGYAPKMNLEEEYEALIASLKSA